MKPSITIRKVENNIETLIITGMIVSDRFLKEIQLIYSHNLMEIPFARTVAKWCIDYWKKYKKAPNVHIQDIYNSQSRNGLKEDMSELIGMFLSSMSHEYERADQFNVDYLLSQAEARFKEGSLKNLAEDIQAYLSQGQYEEAEKLLNDYKRVELPQSLGINPFTDREAIYRAFERNDEETLYTPPSALGKFLGPIERSSLTAFMGGEKKGKTFWLMQFGIWGIKARCNVAFFEVGDMTQRALVRRIHVNNTRSSDKRWGDTLIPVLDCIHNQKDECTRKERVCSFGVMHRKHGSEGEWSKASIEDVPDYVPCTECHKDGWVNQKRSWVDGFKGAVWYKKENISRLNWKHAWDLGKRTMSRVGSKRFKLSVHHNNSINVDGIETQLDRWEQMEGFIPDLIIIDYADILAPMDTRMDERGRQNDTWKALRALSQKRCCAVITATQANAASYTKKSLREDNFSEDKRKYGHATSFITLNQTAEEKKAGIMRLGQMFVRESDFDVGKQCTVLQCLDIGRPYIASFL